MFSTTLNKISSLKKTLNNSFKENFHLKHESLAIIPQDGSCRIRHAIVKVEESKGDWHTSTDGVVSHLSKLNINLGHCNPESILGTSISKIGFTPDGRIQNIITEPTKIFLAHPKPVELDMHLDCALSHYAETVSSVYFNSDVISISAGAVTFMGVLSIDEDMLYKIDITAKKMLHDISSSTDLYVKKYNFIDFSMAESIVRGEVKLLRQQEFTELFTVKILELTESYRERWLADPDPTGNSITASEFDIAIGKISEEILLEMGPCFIEQFSQM